MPRWLVPRDIVYTNLWRNHCKNLKWRQLLYLHTSLPFPKLRTSLSDPCKGTIHRREALNVSVEWKDLSVIAKCQQVLQQIITRNTYSTMSITALLPPSRQDHPRAREYCCRIAWNRLHGRNEKTLERMWAKSGPTFIRNSLVGV